MSKITIMCDRCQKITEGLFHSDSGTAGYYQMWGTPWSKYANPNEMQICDACMWRDPRYIADYGQQTIGGPSDQELKADLEKAIEAVDKAQRRFLECQGEFEDVYPAACGEYMQYVGETEEALINLWREHRDRIGFVVWTDPATQIPQPVITAYPTAEPKP